MNKSLLNIFFALMLIVVIMFTSNYLVFKNSISEVYTHVSANNRMVVDNIIQSFNDSFRDMNNLIFSILMLQENYINSAEGSSDGDKMYNMYALQKNLNALVSTNSYIEEVIVYYQDSNLAVTTLGTIDFQTLMSKKYNHLLYTGDYWKSYIASLQSVTVVPEQTYRDKTNPYQQSSKRLIAFAVNQKIRMSNKNILVFVDVNKLLEHVNQKAMMQGSHLIVLDQHKNVILSTEKNLMLVDILDDLYFDQGKEKTLKNKDYEYNISKSPLNGFIYVHKMPYRFNDMKSVTNANTYIMLITIICGVLLSAILSFFLYRPINRITNLFGDYKNNRNSFPHIYQNIVQLQQNNQALIEQSNIVRDMVRRDLFIQSLDEYVHNPDLDKALRNFYPDLFVKPYFVLVSIHFPHPKAIPQHDDQRIEAAYDRLLAEMRIAFPDVQIFYRDNMRFIAIIGLSKLAERKEMLAGLRKHVERLNRELVLNGSLHAAVSQGYSSKIQHLHQASLDLKNGMAYRNIQIHSSVIDIAAITWTNKMHLPPDALERLSNRIMSGNETEAAQIVNEVLERNVEENIHYEQLLLIAKIIAYHITKHLEDSERNPQWNAAQNRIHNLMTEHSITFFELRDYLLELVRHVTAKRKQPQASKLNAEEIIQYIEIHFANNLYLDHMAEVFNTTPKYFSNYFTKTFGVNFVEHLNKVRIHHAKALLKNTESAVADIGERVGYANSSTFTTTFKKYVGLSPTEYRKKSS
ncbi:helix-turn-helix transcriptional regulator [Paenibacillus marinisediminis]